MTELKALITKYARKVPCVIQTKDAEGKITEEPSGYGLVTNAVPIIVQEVIPAIASRCTPSSDGTTLLYKDDVFRIAYQGAGVEYQAADGSWNDTSGIPVSEYVDKPQRINPALQRKYGVASSASASASSSSSGTGSKVTIHLLTADAESIVSQEVSIP